MVRLALARPPTGPEKTRHDPRIPVAAALLVLVAASAASASRTGRGSESGSPSTDMTLPAETTQCRACTMLQAYAPSLAGQLVAAATVRQDLQLRGHGLHPLAGELSCPVSPCGRTRRAR
jgi:hypothetical protein